MADRSKDISLNNAHQEKLLHDTKKAHQDEIRRGDEARKMLKDYERQNTIFAEDIKKMLSILETKYPKKKPKVTPN